MAIEKLMDSIVKGGNAGGANLVHALIAIESCHLSLWAYQI